ncbi:chymotrypsin BII-like [Eurosta solidaginis]|uniref:chymotrypsin BII-like n=1 Tax=Eurosta solidaginis TaxID=178769 RepID=UPI0035313EB9
MNLLFVLLSCFLTHTNAQFRISNGEDINVESSTHSVAIFIDDTYNCVGSIVNMNSVVTVAHCTIMAEWDKVLLVAGVSDLRQRNSERAQRRNVQRIHYDPGYNEQTKCMDVAVVKVNTPFQRTDSVRSILLRSHPLVPRSSMQVSGWGSLQLNSRTTSDLLKTKSVQIANTQQCKTAYANVLSLNLAETIICAGCGGADVCVGDSGAGGVRNRRLWAVLQGGCEIYGLPDTYTDITNARVRNFITFWMDN